MKSRLARLAAGSLAVMVLAGAQGAAAQGVADISTGPPAK